MREIKFRGFSFPEQRFVFGNYVKSGFNHFIVYDATEDDYRYNFDGVFIPCDEKSIGQFTGLTDKNGKEIYDGDVIVIGNKPKVNVIVFWSHDAFAFMVGKTKECVPLSWFSDAIDGENIEVIGNIHETPELLS